MRISIGILAWNEERSIGPTIESLFEQSLFAGKTAFPVESLEVVVVPNGCRDRTAAVAQQALDTCRAKLGTHFVSAKVCPLENAGKSNAWNEYVHRFADPAADYIFLEDADIKILEGRTLENILKLLEESTTAAVATALPVKDIAFKKNKGLADRISLMASRTTQAKGEKVSGQLYCVRGPVARRIWMPPGILVDDGFFRAMIITNEFTTPEQAERVVRAQGASFMFEAYKTPSSLLHHAKRLAIGNVMNVFLFDDLWANAKEAGGAGQLIRRRNQEDPAWFANMVRQRVQSGGWWVVPLGLVFTRLRRLRGLSGARATVMLPAAVAGFLLEMVAYAAANLALKREKVAGFW